MARGLCSRCFTETAGAQRYCLRCHAAYMREWRKTHRPSAVEQFKGRARAYTKTYTRRGQIVKLPCQACGAPNSQVHHRDYAQPLIVDWLCRPCHLALHRAEREKIAADNRRIYLEFVQGAAKRYQARKRVKL